MHLKLLLLTLGWVSIYGLARADNVKVRSSGGDENAPDLHFISEFGSCAPGENPPKIIMFLVFVQVVGFDRVVGLLSEVKIHCFWLWKFERWRKPGGGFTFV